MLRTDRVARRLRRRSGRTVSVAAWRESGGLLHDVAEPEPSPPGPAASTPAWPTRAVLPPTAGAWRVAAPLVEAREGGRRLDAVFVLLLHERTICLFRKTDERNVGKRQYG